MAAHGVSESGHREIASLFDRESAHYDATYDGPGGHYLRARFAAVLAALGPGPGDVLDAGMGPGRLCAELERRGWRASGLDVSEGMVDLARRRLPQSRERMVQASIDAIPFADDSFDAAVAMGVLEYLDDFPAAVRELGRVLRPDGKLVVSFPHQFSIEGIWRRYAWYPGVRAVKYAIPAFERSAPYRAPPQVTKRRMFEAMQAAGLRPDRCRHVSFSLRPIGIGGWAGEAGQRLAERVEAARPHIARPLATQVVLVAHKARDPRSDGPA